MLRICGEFVSYNFEYLTDKMVKLEESFINSYVDECLKYNSAMSSTQRILIIIDNNYNKAYLNKVMT